MAYRRSFKGRGRRRFGSRRGRRGGRRKRTYTMSRGGIQL